MTFTDIVNKVAGRLNLTTAAALTRIGEEINERYREIATSIGMQTTARAIISASTVVGNRSVTFTCEKVLSVFDPAFSPANVLEEISFDEMRNRIVGSDPPEAYAIQLMGATTVAVYLDCVPSTIYPLQADVEQSLTTLSGTQVPAFSQSYHDILVKGVLALELEKQEKYSLAAKQEDKYEKRMGELRLFIASSAYRDLYQGKTEPSGLLTRLV